jgi:hypothetical protein
MNVCHECGKDFKYPSKLKLHSSRKTICYIPETPSVVNSETTKTVKVKKEHKCSKCEKVLTRKIHLKAHENKCNGLSNLQCSRCLLVFSCRQSKHAHTKARKCVSTTEQIENLKLINLNQQTEYKQKEVERKQKENKKEEDLNEEFNGVIYLLQEREFVKNKTPVFKVGKTGCMKQRMSKYPKGSYLMFSHVCTNIHEAEKLILDVFKTKYTKRFDLGSEYFEGKVLEMTSDIHTVLDKVNKTQVLNNTIEV